MKRYIFIIAAAFCLTVSAKAQYDNYVGPGSLAWCWQQQQIMNAINNRLSADFWRLRNPSYQQMQAMWNRTPVNVPPAPMPVPPMPTFPTPPANSNSYPEPTGQIGGSSSIENTITQFEERQVTCEYCNGGFNSRQVYLGNGNVRTVRSRCAYCHGRGTRKERVLVSR